MNCSVEIKLYDDVDKLCQCLKQEEESDGRSSMRLSRHDSHLSVNIEASDEVAMRSKFNSAMKLLNVFEKMKGL